MQRQPQFLSKTILKKAFYLLALLLLLATIPTTVFVRQHRQARASGNGFPSISGTQLIDSSGHPFLLHGAQIASPFIYTSSWQKKQSTNVTNVLNPTVFQQMSAIWHMNALRLPISNWIYNSDPTHYLNLLDQVVQQANQAGLYVILDLHDDVDSGSPYGSGARLPKTESVTFWQTIAAHFLSNPMVMFDVYNEPQYTNSNTWLNGGGTLTNPTTGQTTQIVGMQALVNAVRSTAAQQIIVIAGIEVAGSLRINDPNIIYTLHAYHDVAAGNPKTWDSEWGAFKGNYPLYYGEWALVTSTLYPYQCQGATPANANQKAIDFMNYMDSNKINWTAWQFNSPYLIQDHTAFAPTNLDDPNNPWTCSTQPSTAGMGTLVYLDLQKLAAGGNGSLQESANSSSPSASTTLNGQDQTISYTVPITVSDTRVSGSGWHLTITSTQFSTSGPDPIRTLPSDASHLLGVQASCMAGSICTHLTNGINYPLLVPAGNMVPAVNFFQAASYTGLGTFAVTPAINLLVPANAYVGTYTSTITVAVVDGP